MLMACAPAAIATFVEVVGSANSNMFLVLPGTELTANVCFRADTGYNSCLTFFTKDDPNGKSSCSSDNVWCFKVVSVDGSKGRIDYSIMFGNRESNVQSSVDNDFKCETVLNVMQCKFVIPNHGFDM
ncbi:14256_t:CDS:1 [Funneliformis caledonium]|uniref:14256_t:CDS:1 n=1 Tax=Funneliformis caledonium TaxID=1117310 RepID=A0A9N9E6V3_9GLOM|nr:14256_t:CDS:1 [Funneliformis caledonium]